MLPSIFFQICCLKSACLGSSNLRKSLAMAGFQLTLYGRIWVTPKECNNALNQQLFDAFGKIRFRAVPPTPALQAILPRTTCAQMADFTLSTG
jgi:hypothetical protein